MVSTVCSLAAIWKLYIQMGGRDVCVHIINILNILNAKAIIHCTGVLYLGPQNNNRDTHKHQYFTNLLTLKCE